MWGGTPWAALTYAGFLFDPANQFIPNPQSNVEDLCIVWCTAN